ncbi:MAG: nitroreductase family protein, partial [Fusobacteriaceae bacterium]
MDLKVLMERKSVRAYEEKEISREIKDKIIEASLRSATAGNMMLYSIIEVDDQILKDKLSVSCDNQPMISKAPFVLIFLADFQRWMDYLKVSDIDGYNKKNNLPEYKPDEGLLVKCINDAMIAAQTSVTAADMLGLGSCYIGDILEHHELH